jgi:hypothetical protein
MSSRSIVCIHPFQADDPVAYNYLGLAIRLSYSLGLHVFNPGTSEKTIATAACWPGQLVSFTIDCIGVSKPIIGEMAKRIWWSMYALEVESSLNCGRPSTAHCFSVIRAKRAVCIRNQDIYIGPPSLVDDEVYSSPLSGLANLLGGEIRRCRYTNSFSTNPRRLPDLNGKVFPNCAQSAESRTSLSQLTVSNL